MKSRQEPSYVIMKKRNSCEMIMVKKEPILIVIVAFFSLTLRCMYTPEYGVCTPYSTVYGHRRNA